MIAEARPILSDPARLAALQRSGLIGSPPEEAFDRITRLATRLLGVPVAVLSVVDGEHQIVRSCQGFPELLADRQPRPLSHTFCQHVVISGAPLVVEDARQDERLQEALAFAAPETVAYLGVPLRTAEGHCLGALCVVSSQPRAWSDDDVATLQDLAAMVTTELDLRVTVHLAERERASAAAERREAAEAQAVATAILESVSDAFLAIDHEWRFTYVNSKTEANLGKTRAELLGRSVWEVFPQSVGSEFYRQYRRAMEDREAVCFEAESTLTPGRWFEIRAYPTEQGISIFCHDITVERRVRRLQEEQHQTLERMANRMRAVAAAASALLRARTPDALQEVLSSVCRTVLPFDAFTFALYDPATHALKFLASRDGELIEPPESVPLVGTPSEYVVANRCSLLTLSSEDPRGAGARPMGSGRRSESVIRTPVLAEDEVLGVISIQSYTPAHYDPLDVQVFEALSAVAASALRNIHHLAERTRAEDALRHSEQHFRALIENASDLITLLAEDGRILYESPSIERILGYRPEELVGRHVLSLVHTEDRTAAVHEFQQAIATPSTPFRVQVRFLHKDDGWRVLQVTGRSLLHDPAVGAFVINSRDITERMEAEQRLRESEASFRTVVESLHEGLLITDLDDVVLYANSRMGEITGFTRHDLVGRLAYEVLLPAEAHPQMHTRNRDRKDGLASTYEIELRRKDGGTVWVEVFGTPFRDAAGTIVGTLGALKDISESKRAAEALRQSELRYRRLVEQATDALFVHDLEGRMVDVNQRACESLGYTREELLALHVSDISLRLDRRELQEMWKQLATGGPRTVEGGQRRKDGSTFPVEVRIGVVEFEGRPLVMALARDITQRKQLEEQLRQAQKMEAVGRLAGGIAHDFNNLLTAITGHAQLILGDLATRDPLHADVSEILRASDRAASLTRQLLAFSRRQVIQPRVVELNSIVSEMQRMLQRLIGEDIALIVTLDPLLGQTLADPGQLEQVIMNLTVNGRDSMPRGGRLVIRTSNARLEESLRDSYPYVKPGDYVLLEVRDTGCGMDEHTLEHIFEPFFTTKEVGKGTGLGLSTVYGIVKQSGGYVWAESVVDQGTTFRVYLPRVDAPADTAPAESRAPTTAPGWETVLLVEDEPSVRLLARKILQRAGYRVLEAAGGAAALRLCDEHPEPIHLLLTDVVMPEMAGPQLAEQVLQRRPGLRVLYMSGYAEDRVVHHGVLDADVAFLEKPFSPDALARKVREVLGPPGAHAIPGVA